MPNTVKKYKLTLRSANEADLTSIISIHSNAKLKAYPDIDPDILLPDHDELTHRWQRRLQEKNYWITVAADNQQVLGFIAASLKADALEITHCYVDSDYWQQGIGTTLINYFIKKAATNKQRLLSLWVVKNSVAESFYRELGFENTSTRKKIKGSAKDTLCFYTLHLNDQATDTKPL